MMMAHTKTSVSGGDPFSDTAAVGEESIIQPPSQNLDRSREHEREREWVTEATLAVGRNATLTLGTDAVIVLDDGMLESSSRSNCCGLLPERSTSTRSIPYHSVLWASSSKLDLTIHYAAPTSTSKKHTAVRVSYIHYTLDDSASSFDLAGRWITRLLDRAYGPAQRRKKIKLLINPYGGTGKAQKLYTSQIEPIFAAAQCEVDVEITRHKGHAAEIAEGLDIDKYDVLACASGDGLPHECFNGLGKKVNAGEALRKVAVVQLPCGSGNAMSWNLNGTGDASLAALEVVKGVRSQLDLVSLTQGVEGGLRRSLSFLSQSLGIVAETDLGTDNIRWMGETRFTVGFLLRLAGKTLYPIEYAVKEEVVGKEEIKRHWNRGKGVLREEEVEKGEGLPELRYGTVNDPLPEGWTKMMDYSNLGNLYCGNMCYMANDAPFFPLSLPADGMMDLVTIDGDVGRMKSVELLLSVPKGTFVDMDCVKLRKISGLRVTPKYGGEKIKEGSKKKKGFFSVDGEDYPFEPFQIEIHRGLGTVLSKRVGVFEYEPVWEMKE